MCILCQAQIYYVRKKWLLALSYVSQDSHVCQPRIWLTDLSCCREKMAFISLICQVRIWLTDLLCKGKKSSRDLLSKKKTAHSLQIYYDVRKELLLALHMYIVQLHIGCLKSNVPYYFLPL